MIHQYKLGGYNIVLDICSGSVHVVDEMAYDVIKVLNEMGEEPTVDILKKEDTYSYLPNLWGNNSLNHAHPHDGLLLYECALYIREC